MGTGKATPNGDLQCYNCGDHVHLPRHCASPTNDREDNKGREQADFSAGEEKRHIARNCQCKRRRTCKDDGRFAYGLLEEDAEGSEETRVNPGGSEM